MAGNENDGLTSKQIKFIDAMLTEPTIDKACQKAGVSRATGHKYLKPKSFIPLSTRCNLQNP
ncbi:phage protein [Streptococcus pneumoniae]|nr:phage protein [Streptococcus pneumoniae]